MLSFGRQNGQLAYEIKIEVNIWLEYNLRALVKSFEKWRKTIAYFTQFKDRK